MKKPTKKRIMVRIIRDPRDATRDYMLSQARAKALYAEGKLQHDLTNSCYSHLTSARTDAPFKEDAE